MKACSDYIVPRMIVLEGKIIKGLLGTVYGIAFRVNVYEMVGDKGVQGECCFDEMGVKGHAKLQVFGGDAF